MPVKMALAPSHLAVLVSKTLPVHLRVELKGAAGLARDNAQAWVALGSLGPCGWIRWRGTALRPRAGPALDLPCLQNWILRPALQGAASTVLSRPPRACTQGA